MFGGAETLPSAATAVRGSASPQVHRSSGQISRRIAPVVSAAAAMATIIWLSAANSLPLVSAAVNDHRALVLTDGSDRW